MTTTPCGIDGCERPIGHAVTELQSYRPLVYDPYHPGDEWPDDQPGLMRVHVLQIRAQRLCDANSRDDLRAWLREHGEPVGGSKHDLAIRIVNRAPSQEIATGEVAANA